MSKILTFGEFYVYDIIFAGSMEIFKCRNTDKSKYKIPEQDWVLVHVYIKISSSVRGLNRSLTPITPARFL